MSIRAGASLPGPFFITFPVGGPLIGLVGLALLPLIAMWYLMVAMIWLMWMLVSQIAIPALRGSVELGSAAADEYRQRQLTPSTRRGISAEDRELFRKLGM